MSSSYSDAGPSSAGPSKAGHSHTASASSSASAASSVPSSPRTDCASVSDSVTSSHTTVSTKSSSSSSKKKNKMKDAVIDQSQEAAPSLETTHSHLACKCTCHHMDLQPLFGACLRELPLEATKFVDEWRQDEQSWDLLPRPVTWNSLHQMYNADLVNPIEKDVMDAFIHVIDDFFQQHGGGTTTFLDSSFYEKLHTFCLCSDGKCKFKEGTPLETALKHAGKEGVKLYTQTLVFFPVKCAGGYWVGLFRDRVSQKSIIYDPCALFLTHPDNVALLGNDIARTLHGEVSKDQPTHMDYPLSVESQAFDIVAPKTPIDSRYSGVLVLSALELVAQMGLPGQSITALQVFMTLSSFVAAGNSEDPMATLKKVQSGGHGHDHDHDHDHGPTRETKRTQATHKTKTKGKKPKQLKIRIANNNNPFSSKLASNKRPAPTATPSVHGLCPETAKLDAALGKLDLKCSTNAKGGYKTTTNRVEKMLLDRIACTIGVGRALYQRKSSVSDSPNKTEGDVSDNEKGEVKDEDIKKGRMSPKEKGKTMTNAKGKGKAV